MPPTWATSASSTRAAIPSAWARTRVTLPSRASRRPADVPGARSAGEATARTVRAADGACRCVAAPRAGRPRRTAPNPPPGLDASQTTEPVTIAFNWQAGPAPSWSPCASRAATTPRPGQLARAIVRRIDRRRTLLQPRVEFAPRGEVPALTADAPAFRALRASRAARPSALLARSARARNRDLSLISAPLPVEALRLAIARTTPCCGLHLRARRCAECGGRSQRPPSSPAARGRESSPMRELATAAPLRSRLSPGSRRALPPKRGG
jgi:hypothetical protein